MKWFKNLSKKKKIIFIIVLLILLLLISTGIYFFVFKEKSETLNNDNNENSEYVEVNEVNDPFVYDPDLPKPQIASGQRGELGIDKNINETNIDKYLGRADSVYRDMRMLEDPAEYSNIGGSRFLDGYIKGFEVVPLPYIIPVTNLPKEVGNTYTGNTLFHLENGVYVPNYEESMSIIEKLFPKNKYIFLMCGGGGYAGMMKEFLVSMGWNEDRIYNVGGFWYYEGENAIYNLEVSPQAEIHNFDNVPYHNIEFDKLTKTSNYVVPNYKVEELKVNTQYVKVEKGMSFQLKVIVLPNEAKNKNLTWYSYDNNIATVDKNGLVHGVNEGIVTIKATSKENKLKEVSIDVMVTNNEYKEKIILDDLSSELNTFKQNNPEQIQKDYYNIIDNLSESQKFKSNGQYTDYYNDLNDEWDKKTNDAINTRKEIFNKLLEEKKSFIVLIGSKNCAEDFRIIDSAKKILDEKNIQYFYTSDGTEEYDTSFFDSYIDKKKLDYSVVVIIKEGKIIGNLRRNFDAIKNDDETRTWLSNYLNL